MFQYIDSWPTPLADFETPDYSKSKVVRAGKLLRNNIEHVNDEVIEAFAIAHNWRSSCAYPMNRIRHELRGKVSRGGGSGITAARLKRMASIRKKLSRANLSLYQMQDIAGARAILPSLTDVDRVTALFAEGETNHSVVRTNDYIGSPKPDGYRSRHIVLKFVGDEPEHRYNRQFVEIQLRTELQHAWATAVEAVGLVRREDLKSGQGSGPWRRFFELMSFEIAERERGSRSIDLIRREELAELNLQINALSELRSYNQALKFTDAIDTNRGGLFLINFDPSSKRATVSPYSKFQEGSAAYNSEDRDLRETNAVLVEVDRVRDLKSAYPNYFLDVVAFIKECELSVPGEEKPKADSMDVSWLSNWDTKSGRRGGW